jgi:PAS domain-containing protein
VGRVVNGTSIARHLVAPPGGLPPVRGILHLSDGLLDQLPIGIATFDCDGGLVRYNRRAIELWGRTPDLGVAADLPVAEVIRARTPLRDREIVLERADGSHVCVSANADPLLGEKGEMLGVVICFTDITALKLKQQERERDARQLLDVLPTALYTTDAEGRITFYNQAAVEFWGRRPELDREQWCGSLRLFHPGGIPLAHEDCPMAVSLNTACPCAGSKRLPSGPTARAFRFLRRQLRFVTARAA